MSSSDLNLYGYTPTAWIGWAFVVLFGVSTVVHIIQALSIRHRVFWLLPTVVLCGVFEVAGWVARALSSNDPTVRINYIIQATLLIIGPIFYTAALYTILGNVIHIVGENYSRLKPRLYLKIFVGADIVCFFIQSGGGGISATAGDDSKAKLGSDITLVGVIIQLISMFCFSLLGLEVAYRVSHNLPHTTTMEDGSRLRRTNNPMSRNIYRMLIGVAITTTLVFARSIYRGIEFGEGFNSTISRTQRWIIIFDGLPMLAAMIVLNVISPTRLLQKELRYQGLEQGFDLELNDGPQYLAKP
ncbi:hypothetical protein M422DRAFT_776364 [Sphaerobolus stellatus SS14]|nr:hypothetical protein M422DRAFT_776364 [Sphaerobolus stellatus SS14]